MSLHVFIDSLTGSRQQLKRAGVVEAFLGSWCGITLREILPEQSLKAFRLRSAYLVFFGHYIWTLGHPGSRSLRGAPPPPSCGLAWVVVALKELYPRPWGFNRTTVSQVGPHRRV